MNPLTNVRNIQNINQRELEQGVPFARSWHQQYRDSAWVFVGGLDYELTEGDVITVFSQYGEINSINLVRDKEKGKSKGFGFVCYKNQLSTVLAVDNLNSIKVCGRTLRVDHVEEYKVPKMRDDMSEEAKRLALHGCAPVPIAAPAAASKGKEPRKEKKKVKEEKKKVKQEPPLEPLKAEVVDGVVLPPRLFGGVGDPVNKEEKKHKKEKKKKSKKSKRKRRGSSSSNSSDEEDDENSKDRTKKNKKKRRVESGESSDDERYKARNSSIGRNDTRVRKEPMDDSYRDNRGNGSDRRGHSRNQGSFKEDERYRDRYERDIRSSDRYGRTSHDAADRNSHGRREYWGDDQQRSEHSSRR